MHIARSSLKLFGARVIKSALSFLAITLFARELGADQVGIYFLFVATLGLLSIPGDAGITKSVEKRLSEGSNPGQILTSAALLKLAILTVISVGILVFKDVVNEYIGLSIAGVLVVGLFVQESSKLATAVLKGELRVGKTATLNLMRELVWLLVGGALVYRGFDAIALVYGVICGMGVVTIWGLSARETPFGLPTKTAAHSLFDYSKFVFISSTGAYLFSWIDILVIGYFLPQKYVGAYEVSWRLTAVVLLLSQSVAATIFPQISEWSANNARPKVERTISKSIFPAIVLVVPAFFGTFVLSTDILQYLFGQEYTIASTALIVLMGQTILQGFHTIVGRSLQAIDRPDLSAYAAAVSIVVNVILNVVLVQSFGLVGAAAATSVAFGVNLGLHAYYLSRCVTVRFPYRSVSWCFVAGGSMFGVLQFIRQMYSPESLVDVVALVAVGAGVYAVALLSYTPIRTNVRRIIREIVF